MTTIAKSAFLATAILAATLPLLASSSYYTFRLDDPKAIYLTPDKYAVHADGIADDSDAIQEAINQEQQKWRQGIVFLPEGRYRISKTIYVWPGIRVIGYGKHRPILFLGNETPGFQQGIGYMVFFTGGRPGERDEDSPHLPFPGTVPPMSEIPDANPGTFYSAMSNIDFEIGDGNPAAVGIRFHVAQHCYLAHMDFHIGSGLAALHDIGNEAEDLHFYSGQYGIMTRKPSPGWQFTLLDSTFEGQREAAIKEHEAGLTLIRNQFRNVPAALSIDPGYAEELWVKDSRFENISGPAITISNEQNARTEINLENIVCSHVPTFALFRESGKKTVGPAETYQVRVFSHGLTMSDIGADAQIKTTFESVPLTSLPAALPPAIPDLPARESWVNLHDLGAVGDGVTNDTAAIQKAIEQHRTIYIPSGRYLVSDTIALKADTVLIGLHPSTTQFDLADATPGFDGPGTPKPLLMSLKGGTNIVTGIGIFTGGINSRAVGTLWMAGKDSLMDDVRFLGGHGTNNADGSRINPYNNTHTADPDLRRRWDGQYPSLWITNGGGGTFADIWTPDTFAQAGLYISDTETEGHVYQLSSEHHVRNEAKLDHVSNWELYALQTEEERGEGPFALPLEIDNSKNITIANYHVYRVVSSYQPFPYAVRVANSQKIRFRNLHVYSDSKVSFDNSVFDQTHDVQVRFREIASLTLSGKGSAPQAHKASRVLATGAKVEKLADSFFNISGAAADTNGNLYFVDAHRQLIYRWSAPTHQLDVIEDHPIDPVNLAFDKAGNLIVVSYAGSGAVYSLRPDAPADQSSLLKAVPSAPRPGLTAILPDDYWRNENDFLQSVPIPKPYQYVSADGSTFLPAGEDFASGALYYGTKMADVLRAFSLMQTSPGHLFYITDESEEKTYSATIQADGTVADVKLFAQRGGESVTTDVAGNVYIAAGQIFVYDKSGQWIDSINIPERPIDILFGGTDKKTLFVLSHSSIYSVRTRAKGAAAQ